MKRANASRIILVVLALTLLWGVGAGVLASAARAEVTISVAPSLVEFKAVPGNVGEQTVTVFNDGDEPFAVAASVAEYGGAPEELSAKDWIEVGPKEFELGPGERRDVRVNIDVPADAPSGGHYATVVFRTGAKNSAVAGAGVSGEIGVPQLFTVRGEGPIEREAGVDRILPALLPDGTIGFQTVLDNTGNIHFFPEGELEVRCDGGSPSETLPVPKSTAVVPGAERFVNAEGALDIPSGANCDADAKIRYAGKREPASGSLAFTPDARLGVAQLEAVEQPGSGPNLKLVLDNTGDLLLNPETLLEVYTVGGERLGSATPARPPSVEPGGQAEIETEYPGRLGPGEYILKASAVYGDQIAERQVNFRLGAAAPQARPGAPKVESSLLTWWMVVGIVLSVVLLLALAIRYLPQLKPVRRRFARAWKALRESEG